MKSLPTTGSAPTADKASPRIGLHKWEQPCWGFLCAICGNALEHEDHTDSPHTDSPRTDSPAPCPAPGTPLPWHIPHGQPCLIASNPSAKTTHEMRSIATIIHHGKTSNFPNHSTFANKEDHANAAYIVHAANAYPALVAENSALRAALAATQDAYFARKSKKPNTYQRKLLALLAQGQGRAATPAPAQSATGTGVGA